MSGDTRGPYRLIVSVNLDRHAILVVGGGDVAERKIRTLTGCGAKVRLISPDATEALAKMAGDGIISWERRSVQNGDFASHRFAVLAVPEREAARLAVEAGGARCAVDVCSDGSIGDFALCAQFEANECFVGASSGGKDPSGAASLKRRIMEALRGPRVRPARILTRNSPLALIQADMWAEAMAAFGVETSTVTVMSHGDRDRASDLSSFGFGAFVKALEDELLSGNGECAVHSLKDMPSVLPEGCSLAAVLERASPRDVLVARRDADLDSLPSGARIGTSSVRRRAQILNARPDLKCVPCRGNVHTRLDKLERGEVDALILAEAGLNRLGIELPGTSVLPFVTSAGQGASAAEARSGSVMEGILRAINHIPTWYEVTAERAFLAKFGFGCVCPAGVNARFADGEMSLSAELYHADSPGPPVSGRIAGPVGSEADAEALAHRLWGMMERGFLAAAKP